jgi:hypothetical protein
MDDFPPMHSAFDDLDRRSAAKRGLARNLSQGAGQGREVLREERHVAVAERQHLALKADHMSQICQDLAWTWRGGLLIAGSRQATMGGQRLRGCHECNADPFEILAALRPLLAWSPASTLNRGRRES